MDAPDANPPGTGVAYQTPKEDIYESEGNWYLQRSTAGFGVVNFGTGTDIPASGDYDGDGKTDIAVFRDGVWYLSQSTNGFASVQFGLTSDKPVPSAYLP